MADQKSGFLNGHFLIAMPGLFDPNFSMTVVCIFKHTESGAVGIVVNRAHTYLSGKDIFDELEIKSISASESIPVFLGGPVHIGEVFVLHGPPFKWKGCIKITPSLALSNTRDILESIAMGNGPKAFTIYIGCAGWGESQLESEITKNFWLTCPVSENIIFDISVETRWEKALKSLGIDPAFLSNIAGHA